MFMLCWFNACVHLLCVLTNILIDQFVVLGGCDTNLCYSFLWFCQTSYSLCFVFDQVFKINKSLCILHHAKLTISFFFVLDFVVASCKDNYFFLGCLILFSSLIHQKGTLSILLLLYEPLLKGPRTLIYPFIAYCNIIKVFTRII